MSRVPKSTSEISTAWLTEVLSAAGRLQSEVVSLEFEPIGAGVGLMGELSRLHLQYAGAESLPATMVAKCAAQNENRQVAQILDFYNREADFYNRIGNQCSLSVPESYHADVEPENYDFVLLMQDLGSVSPPDQLVGASRAETFSAISGIAGVHAAWWGVDDQEHDWMYDMMSPAEAEKMQTMIYMPALEPALEKFSYMLTDEMKRVCRSVGERYPNYWSNLVGQDTFLHGDYRQDNMLYLDDGADALVMDWQISGRGKSVFDVAYFMCQSVPSELRREIEQEVLSFYVGKLSELGVSYAMEDCWNDYRRIILGCLIYPITVCGSLDTANERGKALAECMLSRNLAAIADLDCADLLI